MTVPETYNYLMRARRDLWAALRDAPDAVLSQPLLSGDRFRSIKDLVMHIAVTEDCWIHEDIFREPPRLESIPFAFRFTPKHGSWLNVQEIECSALERQAAKHAQIFCNQVEYHPYLSQRKLLQQAREMGYLLTAYSPIAHGKVKDDPVLIEIGHGHNKSAVQVTLRWLIQQDRVAAIPKAASSAHRRSNFEIFDFTLSDAEMQRIFALERHERLIDPEDGPDWED
jgi:uncharacterized damage-inducible protein DinB